MTAILHKLCIRSGDDGTMVHGDMAPNHLLDTDEDAAKDATLLAHANKIAPTPPGNLQHVLINSMSKHSRTKPPAKSSTNDGEITINDK